MEVIGVPGTIYKESFEQMISQYLNLVRGYIGGGFSVKEALAKAGKADEVYAYCNLHGLWKC